MLIHEVEQLPKRTPEAPFNGETDSDALRVYPQSKLRGWLAGWLITPPLQPHWTDFLSVCLADAGLTVVLARQSWESSLIPVAD